MLISCIMPTRDRRRLVTLALECFRRQDWPERELIVLDDGTDPIEDLATIPGVVYLRHRGDPLSIGVKRNLCCEQARGEVIVHWDDDDWSADDRISEQVALLLSSGKQMAGYHSLFYWSETLVKAFLYEEGSKNYAVGTSMCYLRSFWKGNNFPNVYYGEDNDLVNKVRDRRQLASSDGRNHLVVRAHNRTTSDDRRVGHNDWPEVSVDQLPRAFRQATFI